MRRAGVLAVLLLLLLTPGAGWQAQRAPFPHPAHQKLFPLCEGCHNGIGSGDSTAMYPAAVLCARCHDGTKLKVAQWSGPARVANNLRFDHARHRIALTDSALTCGACHRTAGGAWMDVGAAAAPSCLGCHAHRAEAHLVDARCETCHMPLARTRFAAERIIELPIPPGHEQADFASDKHGVQAQANPTRCATCHTRERCATCHVNAATVAAITAIPAAPPDMALPRFTASYVRPATHAVPDFVTGHGSIATAAACATCHTRDDCATCHIAPQPRVLAEMPARSEGAAVGVRLERTAPPSHAAHAFVSEHGTVAATTLKACTTCHARTSCAACHDRAALTNVALVAAKPAGADTGTARTRSAPGGARFHPATFMLRHSATAYGRRLECSNCHDAKAFCQDCHRQAGLATSGGGRLRTAFHDAEPLWLLRHGRAARQALESCTTCHTQRNCLQCHSEIGAFRVNPHGPDFDARRAHARNPVICFACHLADPLGGTGE